MNLPRIIAIDGPAASGKSTVAEKLAEEIGYLYFDTGVMYRAVTLAALRELGGVSDQEAVTELANRIQIDVRAPSVDDGRIFDVWLDGEDVTWQIRESVVDSNVSCVSAYSGVRTAMTEQQRRIGARGSIIMVGRDIGTVVFPEAEIKFYMDASVEERAHRRYLEVIERGQYVDEDEILKAMRLRDQVDSTRMVAPLRPADDAIMINTDGKEIESVLKEVKKYLDIR